MARFLVQKNGPHKHRMNTHKNAHCTSDEGVDPDPGTEANTEAKATLPVEVADENKCTSVTVTLRTFSLQRPESASRVPNSLSFQLKFYAYEEIITNHSLKVVNGIAKFTHPASFSFVYDCSTADTAEELALYLMERDLYIEVFDSSKYLGTLTLPGIYSFDRARIANCWRICQLI